MKEIMKMRGEKRKKRKKNQRLLQLLFGGKINKMNRTSSKMENKNRKTNLKYEK